jgi:hypothetical protein
MITWACITITKSKISEKIMMTDGQTQNDTKSSLYLKTGKFVMIAKWWWQKAHDQVGLSKFKTLPVVLFNIAVTVSLSFVRKITM